MINIGYIAGLLDGKSSVTLTKPSDKGSSLVISISTKSYDLSQRMAHDLGMTGEFERKDAGMYLRRPCDTHCNTAHEHVTTNRYYRAKVSGIRAIIILRAVEPFITRAQELLKYLPEAERRWRQGLNPGNAAQCAHIVDSMRVLGWPVHPSIIESMEAQKGKQPSQLNRGWTRTAGKLG